MAIESSRHASGSNACVSFLNEVLRERDALLKASNRQRAIFKRPDESLSSEERQYRNTHKYRFEGDEGSLSPGPVLLALQAISDELQVHYCKADEEARQAHDTAMVNALRNVFDVHQMLVGLAHEKEILSLQDLIYLDHNGRTAHLQDLLACFAPKLLSDTEETILHALIELTAFDKARRKVFAAVVKRASLDGGAESYSRPLARLKNLRLIGSQLGRQGGYWITPKGRAAIGK